MSHWITVVFVASILSARALSAQSPQSLAFGVASIKLNASGDARSGTHTLPGGRVTITNQRLRDVVRTAFGSNDLDVIGGPAWMDGDRWDIVAAASSGNVDAPWEQMLKSLLVDRFHLQAHVEHRERSIYRLVLARGDKQLGPDLHESRCTDDLTDCSRTTANTSGIKSGTITGIGRSMADLAVSLGRYAERRVFDGTRLESRYDFQLQWSEDVSIFTALQEQLGLKLESARAPVDVVVIDRVERPTPD
jgi:uncharacterized protein (TIGR03435 family)